MRISPSWRYDKLVIALGATTNTFGTPGAANVLRVISAAGPDEWDPSLCDIRTEECGPDV